MKKPNWRKWIKNKEDCKNWLDSYLKKEMIAESDKEKKMYYNKSMHNLNLANWLNEKQDVLKELFDENFYDWVITVYYYSVYHASLALVSMLGYKSRSHMSTLCFIIYNYYHGESEIKEDDIKIIAESIDKEDIDVIAESKSLRERASYNIHETFEKELADDVKNKTVKFLEKTRTILEIE
ncbi:hypothetical protein GF336_01740 [Candidatus Woesearchaeota archaeon]|nr:hypothetical protein [Candidatus Woesearchaeota archaeon]